MNSGAYIHHLALLLPVLGLDGYISSGTLVFGSADHTLDPPAWMMRTWASPVLLCERKRYNWDSVQGLVDEPS